MTEEALVQGYIDAVVENPQTDDEDVISALAVGVEPAEVVAAMHFTQIAFGRFLLEGMPLNLPEEYVRMRPDGEIYERGIVETHPMFVAARLLAATPAGMIAFQTIVERSPEVNVISKMLQTGSPSPGARMSPLFIIDSPPTDEGKRAVRAFVESELCTSEVVN
ncbi:MAG: hypothetical protein GY856_23290 [bacterium]|nr:hypothetical protein [bacterium]